MKKYILPVLPLLFLVQLAIGQPEGYTKIASKSEFKAKIAAAANKTNSIDSKFTQKKRLSFMSQIITTEGRMFFKKENFLRWEYTKPYEYLILINNGKMTIKDEEEISNFDLQSNTVFQKVNDMIINSVQGNALDESMYFIEIFENNTYALVELVPKESGMKEFIEKIQLYFNKSDYSVDRVKMLEPMDDYTSIIFHDKKLNTSIPNEKFIIH